MSQLHGGSATEVRVLSCAVRLGPDDIGHRLQLLTSGVHVSLYESR